MSTGAEDVLSPWKMTADGVHKLLSKAKGIRNLHELNEVILSIKKTFHMNSFSDLVNALVSFEDTYPQFSGDLTLVLSHLASFDRDTASTLGLGIENSAESNEWHQLGSKSDLQHTIDAINKLQPFSAHYHSA